MQDIPTKERLSYLNKLKLNKLMPGYYAIYFRLLEGHFESTIRNATYSKQLQKFLQFWSSKIINKIFLEIYPHLQNLMKDPYGNYFCQKLYKYLSHKDKLNYLIKIQSDFFQIATNEFGNYSLQYILENMRSNEEKTIFMAPFNNHAFLNSIINSPVGIFVVEKILATFDESYLGSIYEYVLKNYKILAISNLAIRMMIKLITNCRSVQIKSRILYLTFSNFNYCIFDKIGNLTIQTIFEVNKIYNF